MNLFSPGSQQSFRSRAIVVQYGTAMIAAALVVWLSRYVVVNHWWTIVGLLVPASLVVTVICGPGPGVASLVLTAAVLSWPGFLSASSDMAGQPIGPGALATAIVLTLPAIGVLDSYRRRTGRTATGITDARQLPHPLQRQRSDMARTIVPSTALELATDLQRRLDERIRADARLAAEHSVTRILAHSDTFEEAAPQILKAICANLDFEIGDVWLLDPSRGRLQCCDLQAETLDRFRLFEQGSRESEFQIGVGLPGRVWESRTPAWIVDLTQDANFPRASIADQIGLRSGCAFPIISGDRFFGVMEFFSLKGREPDQEIMNSMAVVGSEIGQFILRKVAERELHDKHLQLQAVNDELHTIQVALRQQNDDLLAAQRALESERQRYLELFQFAPDGYIVTNLDGVILEANHSAAVQLNAQPRSLVGENALDYIDGSQIEEVQQRMQALRDGVVSRQALDFRIMPFDAEPINAAVTLGSMRDHNGSAIGFRWLIRDVGHWRQIEGELAQHRERLEELIESRTAELEATHERLRFSERMASIGTLATGLGHDIGNFVLPVLCRLETLAEQPLPPETIDEVKQIQHSVLGLRNLSKGLSLFALDPEDVGYAPRSTEIESWWADAGPLLRKAVPKHIELRCEFEPSLPKVGIAPHQLTQTVRNILTNAGEASTERGVVRFWCRRSDNGANIMFGVTDQGVGMADDVRQHAFEPFFTTKKRSLSTGLGLSVVHAVVKSVGGSVDIESELNRGTTVTITLPTIAEPDLRSELSLRGAAITLADDRLASYAQALLVSAGIVVEKRAEPSDELLWITEPAEGRLEPIRRFLAGRQERRVMLIGQPADGWNLPGVLITDGSHRAMHQALQKAVLELF